MCAALATPQSADAAEPSHLSVPPVGATPPTTTMSNHSSIDPVTSLSYSKFKRLSRHHDQDALDVDSIVEAVQSPTAAAAPPLPVPDGAGAARAGRVDADAAPAISFASPKSPMALVQILLTSDNNNFSDTTGLSALLDTGAQANSISGPAFRQLVDLAQTGGGCVIDTSTRQTITGFQKDSAVFIAHQRVTFSFVLTVLDIPRQFTLTAWVVENQAEDCIIGWPFMRDHDMVHFSVDLLIAETAAASSGDDSTSFEISHDVLPQSDNDPSPEQHAAVDKALRARCNDVVDKFPRLFNGDFSKPAKLLPMEIHLKPGATLPRPVTRRARSPAQERLLAESAGQFAEANFIRPSDSKCCSAAMMVPKPGGGPEQRFVCALEAINEITEDYVFPIGQVKETIRRLEHEYYTVIDARHGFHLMELRESDRYLTAFQTRHQLWEWTRGVMGLKNTPAYFQRAMNHMFADLIGVELEIYIDDIVIYADTADEMVARLEKVLARLDSHGMQLKRSKIQLALREIYALGHHISKKGIRISKDRSQSLLDMVVDNHKSMRSFLGLAGWFRDHVPDLGSLTAPLFAKPATSYGSPWTEEETSCFERIKAAVADAPLLHFIDYERPILLRTDASRLGIGGYLFQLDAVSGAELPVCFVSKAFTAAERAWSTTDQEAYAIYYCILKLSSYIQGHHFIVETDHRNLTFMSKPNSSPRVQRWFQRLQAFTFTLRHLPGVDNPVADGLSRCFEFRVVEGLSRCFRLALEPDDESGVRLSQTQLDTPLAPSSVVSLVEPSDSLRDECPHFDTIARVHNSVVGHRGFSATCRTLRQLGLAFTAMEAEVRRFLAGCPTCQKVRSTMASASASLHTTERYEPFEVFAADVVGPLPRSHGFRYFIVFICLFTRFVEIVPIAKNTAISCVDAMIQVYGRYGAPRLFHQSDGGSNFTADLTRRFLKMIGISAKYTLPYRPQANGIVERSIQEVMGHLRALTNDWLSSSPASAAHSRWPSLLPLVQRLMNCTVHSAIGIEPIRLVFGNMVTPDRGVLRQFLTQTPEASALVSRARPAASSTGDPAAALAAGNTVTPENYLQLLFAEQARLHSTARDFQRKEVERRIRQRARLHPVPFESFEDGDYVLVDHPNAPVKNKLSTPWFGPLFVVEADRDDIYMCQDLVTNKVARYHASRLIKFDTLFTHPIHPELVARTDYQEKPARRSARVPRPQVPHDA